LWTCSCAAMSNFGVAMSQRGQVTSTCTLSYLAELFPSYTQTETNRLIIIIIHFNPILHFTMCCTKIFTWCKEFKIYEIFCWKSRIYAW
jgi:hypothetical protein